MTIRRLIFLISASIFCVILYINLVGFSDGITGHTKKAGNTIGCICHGADPDSSVSVIISGPSQVSINDTAIYTLRISGGRNIAAGCDIASNLGLLGTTVLDTSLQFLGELTHRYPKLFDSDTLVFIFKYTAPATPGVYDTLYATGNSVNYNGRTTGDVWNFSENFPIEIIDRPLPVELISFTSIVNGANVRLNWNTSFERNNSGFEIQRMTENNQWHNAGFVQGRGTISTSSFYTFEDKNLAVGKYKYRLKQIDFNGNFEYFNLSSEAIIESPSEFSLSQNYPNPFNPSTVIRYSLTENSFVTMKIYDALGKEVASLVNEMKDAGNYEVDFNGSNLSSGVYFYRLEAGKFSDVKSMILSK